MDTGPGFTPRITRLMALAHLGRMSMAPLTVSVPILGALTLGQALALRDLFGLGALGLCAHLFGFAINDLIDQPLDRTVPALQQHPLVTGRLGQREAWAFALGQVPLALGLYFWLGGAGAGLAVLGVSMGLSVIYNLWSKRGRVPRLLPEMALALSVGLLCLSGAMLKTAQIPSRSLLYALTLSLVLLLLNSVSSGLKDLKTDAAFGATSFVLSTGSRMVDADGIYIAKALWLYGAGLQSAILAGLLCLLKLFGSGAPVVILAGILCLYAALHLRLVLSLRSFAAVRGSLPLLNGYYNYAALALVIAAHMPLGLQVLYGLLILSLLSIPWRLSWRIWRRRYEPAKASRSQYLALPGLK